MKLSDKKKRVLCGMLLLVGGLLLMFVPQLTHIQVHHMLCHAIIVFGAVCVLLSFPLFYTKQNPKKP